MLNERCWPRHVGGMADYKIVIAVLPAAPAWCPGMSDQVARTCPPPALVSRFGHVRIVGGQSLPHGAGHQEPEAGASVVWAIPSGLTQDMEPICPELPAPIPQRITGKIRRRIDSEHMESNRHHWGSGLNGVVQ
jgi:hypothetical protein